jgi:carbon monoxide dehydrogenase subunit G
MSSVTQGIQIDAPGEKVWAILADIGSVQDYSPGVVKSYYTSDVKVGVGASRHCDLLPTGTVEERIVNWLDRKQYSIEIYDWTDVPYTGIAEFTVKPSGKGTTVTQSMDYRPTKVATVTLGNRSMEELVIRVVEGNLLGLKHFIETGEAVTREVFKRIKKSEGVK